VVVHQVVAELAAVVAEAVRKTVDDELSRMNGRGDGRRAAGRSRFAKILDHLVRLGVDDAHPDARSRDPSS
jgi:hypothetical protein